MLFKDRKDAGIALAIPLLSYRENKQAIVIGLARGGVVTAFEVAQALHLPLDVITPRKVGAPMNPELALGAVTNKGEGYLNERLISTLNVSPEYLQSEIEKEKKLSFMRQALFRKNRAPIDVNGKTVILVDDGLATGATMKAAIQWAKKEQAKEIVVALPVAPQDSVEDIRQICKKVICLHEPLFFQAVGEFYEDFRQTSDEEVVALLHKHH